MQEPDPEPYSSASVVPQTTREDGPWIYQQGQRQWSWWQREWEYRPRFGGWGRWWEIWTRVGHSAWQPLACSKDGEGRGRRVDCWRWRSVDHCWRVDHYPRNVQA